MEDQTKEIFQDLVEIVKSIRSHKTLKMFQKDIRSLTMAQLHVLHYLYEKEKGTMGELSTYAKVKMPTMTDTVNRLVKLGYVKRNHSESDRRNVVISTTAKGKEVIESHRTHNMGHLDKFMKTLEINERDTMIKVIRQLRGLLEKQG